GLEVSLFDRPCRVRQLTLLRVRPLREILSIEENGCVRWRRARCCTRSNHPRMRTRDVVNAPWRPGDFRQGGEADDRAGRVANSALRRRIAAGSPLALPGRLALRRSGGRRLRRWRRRGLSLSRIENGTDADRYRYACQRSAPAPDCLPRH